MECTAEYFNVTHFAVPSSAARSTVSGTLVSTLSQSMQSVVSKFSAYEHIHGLWLMSMTRRIAKFSNTDHFIHLADYMGHAPIPKAPLASRMLWCCSTRLSIWHMACPVALSAVWTVSNSSHFRNYREDTNFPSRATREWLEIPSLTSSHRTTYCGTWIGSYLWVLSKSLCQEIVYRYCYYFLIFS